MTTGAVLRPCACSPAPYKRFHALGAELRDYTVGTENGLGRVLMSDANRTFRGC